MGMNIKKDCVRAMHNEAKISIIMDNLCLLAFSDFLKISFIFCLKILNDVSPS